MITMINQPKDKPQTHPKVTASHRDRMAYIYIRQSTVKQVLHNQESQLYQRRLSEQAALLGWSDERIKVVDSDLAQSGRESSQRQGFQKLVTEVSLGNVGIIFSYEVSRLARNNSDWYQLLDLAAMFDTLIADSDGIYNPYNYNDRLLLGLKGTMSEAELYLLKQRLSAGRLNQVKRGEYRQRLPTGLIRESNGQVSKDPDKQVQDTIQFVLNKFALIGSCGKVVRHLRSENVLIPRRHIQQGFSEIVWKVADIATVSDIIKNPAYAGAFVYGRSQSSQATNRRIRKDLADWIHIEQKCYPSFISWQQFLQNQEQIKQNAMSYKQLFHKSQGVTRNGSALLQGLIVCGYCGHKIKVHYKVQKTFRYSCSGLQRTVDTSTCMSINGSTLDAVVVQAFFEVLRPANLDMLEEVLKHQKESQQQIDNQWQQRLERSDYEVSLAHRRYQAVDPDNRLVAAELEKQWELKLQQLQEHKEAFKLFQQKPVSSELCPQLKEQFQHISDTLPTLWTNLDNDQKKELLRSLIKSVIVTDVHSGKVELKIVWISGHHSLLVDYPPALRQSDMLNHEQLLEHIHTFWKQGDDDKTIAKKLSDLGFRSARSTCFNWQTVQKLRLQNRWLSFSKQIDKAQGVDGYLTMKGLAEKLECDASWISRKIKDYTIPPEFVKRHPQGGVYLIKNTPETIIQIKQRIKSKRKSHH